ncbi:DNA-binding response regulator [Dulcicalothrix desertica PCC 7102]|uniref:DNA-binding response regulator n=1 Tax=Dulcicalothrix desertica PCC 7102 TaxID=232991 RepID=A0A433VBH2_9CYAN|nr:response regulator transcription factor [Dulcicalothrix desertica]RUT03413.1 DNA-binding response regulator [Dulcicalothrix desertica PCC 7102]TWH50662.1 LuxR family two component transcriptional regulator [Dulcicalothrix desertica PCC 7102]
MSESNFIRIIVADDHPVVRQGLATIIERELDMSVVGQASNGWEAKELYSKKRPDVVLMDLRMPKLSGAAAIQNICTDFDDANIIILTTYDSDEDIYNGIQAGAKGYLLKDTEPEEILYAIRTVANGQKYISKVVATKLKERMQKPELSQRELEVLQLITNGNTNQQVAAALFITEGTVKYHVNNILGKLGVSDRTQAVVAAVKRGIVKF